MPATTVIPCRAAMSRTAVAHGPSRGSATGVSETPKAHIVASGSSNQPGARGGRPPGRVGDQFEVALAARCR